MQAAARSPGFTLGNRRRRARLRTFLHALRGGTLASRITAADQQTIEEIQPRMRRRQLPQFIDIRSRGLEIIRLESSFNLRNEVRDLTRIFGGMSDHRRRSPGCLALRPEHLETQEHHNSHDGNTTADHRCQAFHIKLVRSYLVVGPRGAGHGGGF
jgi:hypothetical protein